jgi:hypothetical protein
MNTMIPLTIANTLDQSAKQRVEAKPNQTLKNVVQQHDLAPKGNYDIYDREGKVITNEPAQNHREATVYVGVSKIAGGAIHPGLDFDDDDDWDIDIEEPNVKPREVTFILQNGERHSAQPNDREYLIDTYKRVVGGPRDGTPVEIMDSDGNAVSSRLSRDMIGRTFRVHLRAIPGGGTKIPQSTRTFLNKNLPPFPAIVPYEIIEQTTAFTQPRGRLEMGGLLIGHVDHQGNNVIVCGFFPRQDEASPGYCEFHGSFSVIAADACDFANSKAGGPHTPDLRVLGWIHTHPDIGIFLSGIDVNTFKALRTNSFEQRCVAVVVDPLRKEHGVFTSESRARNHDAEKADGTVKLSEDLESRYHKFLNRMRQSQIKKGKEEIPFILPGILRRSRIAMGDVDDVLDAKLESIDVISRQLNDEIRNRKQLEAKVRDLEISNQNLSVAIKNNQNFVLQVSADNKSDYEFLKTELEKLQYEYLLLHEQMANKMNELIAEIQFMKSKQITFQFIPRLKPIHEESYVEHPSDDFENDEAQNEDEELNNLNTVTVE